MAQATILSEEQMNIISSDLAGLIQKLEQLQQNSELLNLGEIVKKEIREAIREQSIFEHMHRSDLVLEDNLKELLKVKTMFYKMRKTDIVSNLLVILATVAITVPVTVYSVLYFL